MWPGDQVKTIDSQKEREREIEGENHNAAMPPCVTVI